MLVYNTNIQYNMPLLTQDAIDTLIEFFNFVDTDKDGFITVDEIKAACAVDLNNDGVIDAAEVAKSAAPWLDIYLAQQDTSGDNKVTLAELVEFNEKA
jgi:Ca2+-binding EF-hand superfamily protein